LTQSSVERQSVLLTVYKEIIKELLLLAILRSSLSDPRDRIF